MKAPRRLNNIQHLFSKSSLFLILGIVLFTGCSGGFLKTSGVKDESSNGRGGENTAPIEEDASSLSVSLSTQASTLTSLTKLTLNIEFSKPVTGFSLSDITYSAGILTNLSGAGASYTAQISFLSAGIYNLSIPAEAAQDSAGNMSLASNSLSITFAPGDEVAQVSSPPPVSSNSTNLDIDVSGDDLAFYHYKIGLKGSVDCSDPSGYIGPVAEGTNITDDISGLGDGEVVVCMVGTDSQGSQQDYSNATEYVVNIDTQDPTLSGLSNDATWVGSKTWNWSCSEECSYDFVIDSSAVTNPAGSYSNSTSATHASGEGQVYLHVQARDAAGNESALVHVSANVDAIAPSVPVAMDDSDFINSLTASPSASWTASSDAGSGLSHYEVAIGTNAGGTNILGWTDVGTNQSYGATGLTLSGGSTYYTSVRAVDSVGNTSAVAQGNGWATDVAGPSAVTDLSDAAGDGDLSSSPTLSWTAATDSGSGVNYYELAIGTSSGGTDILDWENIGSGTSHQEIGLSLTDGLTYFASIRAVDNLGNQGVAVSSAGWIASATADPCSGTTIGQACSGTTALYAGEFDNGKYMVTPSNCEDSATPTCNGASDTLTKRWRGTNGSDVDIPDVETIAESSPETPSSFLGAPNTAMIVIDASIDTDSAADYCNNMNYGGYSDWYLPSKSELVHIYCHSSSPMASNSHPAEDPDCGSYGGRSNLISGFNATVPYLSSTEISNVKVWSLRFSDGQVGYAPKSAEAPVRCIRRY